MLKLWRVLLCQMAINTTYHIVKANLCLGGQDIFAKVRENSPTGEFIANLSITGEPGANSIRLCLTGDNADWFYLEGKSIRLNSFSRLDREVQGSVLIAALKCYEDGMIQLTAVNTVIFTVQAKDADNDTIMYVIDNSSLDGSYFKTDLSNSGKVVLAKPLDYETKTRLQFVISAVEMDTREKYNTTANITVNVLDGDDQYPQFQPCILLSQDRSHLICTNPIYTVNITEKEQDTILYFSPGSIHAVDGDRGLMTPLLYTILSGADNGRFRIANETGEVVLTRRVENRLLTPILRLRIMASQRDDPKKYTVATALIRVLAENRFPPQFNRTTYKGFITADSSPATLVSTYGSVVLVVQAVDQDFKDGMNPKVRYSLRSNNTGLYDITQEGLLIAKTNQLQAFEKHHLEVLATDQESGEVVKTSIDIDVLQKDQPVPQSPFGEERLYGRVDINAAGGVATVGLLLLVATLFLFLQLAKKRRRQQYPSERASLAQGKHPNVVDHGRPTPLTDELSYHNEAFGAYDASSSILHGKHGIYTRKVDTPVWTINRDCVPHEVPLGIMAPEPLSRSLLPSNVSNARTSNKSVSFKDEVMLEEKGETAGECSCCVEVQLEMKQEYIQGDSVAHSPQKVLASQSNKMRKTQGEKDTLDKSDAANHFGGGDDTSKGQKGKNDNNCNDEDEDEPENPYKSMHPVMCISGDEDL
ncbi:hypothetical protein AAFF_G00171520 [Aldrovandia affinis]|uniref:Cadherin domain-containing protein n=1 Tax=Aldrovandia affinis TaxID=143900 RepID=A0AAD7WVJ1_9TELE|nr:hypothetical protein AAFF_G00171520 [Aldrovandia affinis]